MSTKSNAILDRLATVDAERRRRAADAALSARVVAVKAYQHRRFMVTYADLLASTRFGRAARFFLDDLYGPHDFTRRDDQFARIVPPMARLFPQEISKTVLALAELHALSETLDTLMAQQMSGSEVDAAGYVTAWQAVGRPADRQRQIELMLAVGSALDQYTRSAFLRHSLRLMRGPARAAGLGDLQGFLETGFDTFREMRGAKEFLDTIASRERALAAALFAAKPGELGTTPPLGQLP